jgi:hypothetical protein
VRESKIEHQVCQWAVSMGILPIKLTSSGSGGWPDHLFLSLKRTKIAFVEFKAPGKLAGLRQELRIEDLQNRGFPAKVIDSYESGIAFLVAACLSEDGGETWDQPSMRWIPYEPRHGEDDSRIRNLSNLKG